MKSTDLSGIRFGRLTVIGNSGIKQGTIVLWTCRCDCGAESNVRSAHLKNGIILSCGCLGAEQTRQRLMIHGMSKHPLFGIWNQMCQRCVNKNHISWKYYGGTGITVCERWQGPEGFINFLADMGERPSAAHSLDRKIVSLPYNSDNCRWATTSEQARNKNNNRMVQFNGESRLLVELAEEFSINYNTLRSRIRYGWSIDDALKSPVK